MRFIVAFVILYLVDLQELKNGESIQLFGYFFLAFLAIIFLLFPTDDLALDKDNLYLIRRSLFTPLNRTLTYRIANLKGIGVYNISAAPGVFTLLAPVHEVNRIEITFADDSSTSQDVTVSKKEIKKILLQVRGMIKKNNAL
jgi:hypothetical protein